MSTRAVIISLVVAVALGLAAYILLRPEHGRPNLSVVAIGEPIIDLDTAAVKSMRVSVPGEPDQLVERVPAPASGQWRLVISGAAANGTWPVLPERPTGLLRVIASVRAVAEPEKDATIGADPVVVSLTLSDGSIRTMRLASRTLGGTGLVEIDPAPGSPSSASVRRAMVDDTLYRSFRSPGPRGWRDPAVLPGSAAEASRIRLENMDRSLVIARVEGRWRLNQPVSCDADEGAVTRLARALDGLQITDYLDGRTPDAATTGLGSPVARIVLETDRRVDAAPGTGKPDSDGMSVQTTSREVVAGLPADSRAQTRYARLGQDGPVVIIAATGLTTGLFDPAQYASPIAATSPAADIGTIVLEAADPPSGSAAAAPSGVNRTLVRRLETWVQAAPTGEETPLTPADVKAVQDLLVFLTKKPAASVTLERPAAYMTLGRISTRSLGCQPLGVLEIGSSDGSSLILFSHSPGAGERRGVFRVYPAGELPALLAPFAAAAKAANPAPTAPAGADAGGDIVK